MKRKLLYLASNINCQILAVFHVETDSYRFKADTLRVTVVLTSLFRASVAVPLISGSIDRRVSRSDRADGATSLNL